MKTVTFSIPEISCEHCANTIERVLSPIAGVKSVKVFINEKQACVEYDEGTVDIDTMKGILAEEDYPVASVSSA